MVFRRFTIFVVLQLSLILLVLAAIAFLFFRMEPGQYIYTFIVLISLLGSQVYLLFRFITRTNRELAKFIDSINQGDFSLKYPVLKTKSSQAELHDSFNTILEAFKNVRIDREMQFDFLQLIIGNIEIGIIVLNGQQEIILMNTAAEKLLGMHKSKNWRQLKVKAGYFCVETEGIFQGGKKLIEGKQREHSVNLSIEVINTNLLEQPAKLITITDIKKEMEQKELDAWIRLIRVLNHEIMNSTTPISSLTETILMLLENKKAGPKPLRELNDDTIADVIASVKTIQKRSNSLYNFVNEYRKVTKIPPPKKEHVMVKELVDNVFILMQPTLTDQQIKFSCNIHPEGLTILMDPGHIEQVLINLIKNSMEALTETKNPEIHIVATYENERPIISVSDNGQGIDPEIFEEIFVPFFSTREEGSGIGLSLSRQIMRLHEGSVTVQSSPGISTTFILTFQASSKS